MRLLRFVLLLWVLAPHSAHAAETRAEHAASVAAQVEMNAAPPHGNLPDYALAPDKLARAQHISAVRVRAHFGILLWEILQAILLLQLGGIAWMRDRAVAAGASLDARGRRKTSRWVQGLIFVALYLLATTLLNLPINLYLHHFSVANGFSVQGWTGWFGDLAKGLGFTLLGGWLVTMLLFAVIRNSPRRWWLVFWPIGVVIALVGVYAAPLFYDPYFHHFEPLQQSNPALVARLEQVVAKGHMDIPPERMFLMQASAKTTTVNAYVTGFGSSKRVVIWDTLLRTATPDEVLFIFGHESGHYVLGHIVQGLWLSVIGLLIVFYIGFRFVQWALARFGPRWRIPSQDDGGTLAVLRLAFTLVGALIEPIENGLIRRNEHAADVYGQEAVHGLGADPRASGRDAMAVLGLNYLEEPNTPLWQELWLDNHPATGRRAAFAAHYDPWAPGMEPRYLPPEPVTATLSKETK